MNEIFGVMLSLMPTKSFMNSRINEFFMMFFLAKGKNEVPVACKVLIVFKMNELVFFHDDLF